MDQAKYKECEEQGSHDFGYNQEAGLCLHCSMLHDCRVEFDFEYINEGNWACNECHAEADSKLVEEIEEENAEARLIEAERIYQ